MKFSFSTLGCPDWSWEDILSTAKDLGFDGVELRGIGHELYIPKAKPFDPANLQTTREKLKKLGLEIPCLTSACYLFDQENTEAVLREGMEYIDLAVNLGSSFIRVLGDRNPEPGKEEIDLDFVAANLKKLAEYAAGKQVTLLIETNGVLGDSQVMAGFIEKVNHPAVGVLWDIHHPFRYFHEQVEKTYTALKKHIRWVHVKDSIVDQGKVRYRMTGYGDVPVEEALLVLKQAGYDGYISLEWVKRWNMDLEEPGIVFSHFINFVKNTVR